MVAPTERLSVRECAPSPSKRAGARRSRLALAAWGAIVAIGAIWGAVLNRRGLRLALPTPPLAGHRGPGLHVGLLLPAMIATIIIAGAPLAMRRLRWPRFVAVAVVATLVWTLALALADGHGSLGAGLTRGLTGLSEYIHDARHVHAHATTFLRTFTRNLPHDRTQLRGHPPGFVLLLALLDAVGLGGAMWEAVLVIGAGVSAVAAVLLAVRDVAGEDAARRAAPWLVISPYAIWIASTADALYMALAAWSTTMIILATSRRGSGAAIFAFAGGLLGGLALLGSYGVALAAILPLVVALHRRQLAPVAIAAAGAFVVLTVFAAYGFWWPSGLVATLHEYRVLPLQRPYSYFLINNLSAWALTLGPAIAVALVQLRDRSLWIITGTALASAVFADVSGLSSGEVERIWLPFTIWVLVAGAALSTDEAKLRRWLGLQASSAIVLIALVTTGWCRYGRTDEHARAGRRRRSDRT
jgi:hypothetical protein